MSREVAILGDPYIIPDMTSFNGHNGHNLAHQPRDPHIQRGGVNEARLCHDFRQGWDYLSFQN